MRGLAAAAATAACRCCCPLLPLLAACRRVPLRTLAASHCPPASPAPHHLAAPARSIFAALGHPGTQTAWPAIESLRHWREDTGGCRQPRADHGSINLKQLLWENSPLLR